MNRITGKVGGKNLAKVIEYYTRSNGLLRVMAC